MTLQRCCNFWLFLGSLFLPFLRFEVLFFIKVREYALHFFPCWRGKKTCWWHSKDAARHVPQILLKLTSYKAEVGAWKHFQGSLRAIFKGLSLNWFLKCLSRRIVSLKKRGPIPLEYVQNWNLRLSITKKDVLLVHWMN